MTGHWGKRGGIKTRIMAILLGLLAPVLVFAGPVGLPDSARPGAVRPPTEDDKLDVPRPAPDTIMEVPPVIDRPFDVDECPCVVVSEFRLLKAADMPEYKIRLTEVQQILSENVEDQPEQGYSIGQLQEVANEVRNYYRNKGLILTQVVVPVQEVAGGVVELELFVGRLGRVLHEGNEIYSAEVLEMAFGKLVGKPIHKAQVEAALLRLTDFPGLTVFGVFQPGQLVGTADLVLKVQEERRFDVALRFDNHGTDETGKKRFRTVIDWNNPTGGADKLTLSFQQTYDPKNSTFIGLDYKRFFGDGSYSFNAFINNNEFDVGGEFEESNIESETDNVGFFVEKSFIRSRVRNFNMRVGYTNKENKITTMNQPTTEDELSVLNLGFDYDSVDTFNPFRVLFKEEGGGGINFASLDLYQGLNDVLGAMGDSEEADAKPVGFKPSRQGGPPDNEFAEGKFNKLFGSYTRLQTVRRNMSILFRGELQWSDDILVPLEQYSVGGPDNVRAFPVAQVLWDKALFYSFEFLFNAPFFADKPAFKNRTWGELLQFSIFYDFAVGKVNEPLVSDEQTYENLKGGGLGLRFNLPGSIESRMFWAWEIGGEETADGDDMRFWFDFTYSFGVPPERRPLKTGSGKG